MPKIQEIIDKKTGQVKHSIILPREVMQDWAVQKGDTLVFQRVMGNEITFRLERAKLK